MRVYKQRLHHERVDWCPKCGTVKTPRPAIIAAKCPTCGAWMDIRYANNQPHGGVWVPPEAKEVAS